MIAASFFKMIEHEEFARISTKAASKLAKRLIRRLNRSIPFPEKLLGPAN
jgi:hypothetical protein